MEMESGTDEESVYTRNQPGGMWAIDQRMDQPLGPESDRIRTMNDGSRVMPMKLLLRLAFQSLGIVYGDLGTSPLYVFRSTFPQGLTTDAVETDVLGALSLIIYTLTLLPLIKYMFIVLKADDNGEGGTFALYSLLCRCCGFSSLPNRHPTDEELTNYSVKTAAQNSHSKAMRERLQKSKLLQNLLLILVLLSTSMVIGDGILTPAISVLSAVDGIKLASSKLTQGVVVVISLVILISLFSVQRYGTDNIGFLFAPIVTMWFLANGTMGIYNIVKHNASVFRAFSPHFAIRYLLKEKQRGWSSLGGIVLCITGTEALYADLGHFSAASIQIAFSLLVFPCLLLAYLGQAAFLLSYPDLVQDSFYASIPKPFYWPMFVLSTVAASIASQAIISATFSIVKQSAALGCFPRVRVIHTSSKLQGQVYIPEVNWILMVFCLIITAGFKDTQEIGNAYGIAVVGVMLSTTIIMFLVMVVVWQTHIYLAVVFLVVIAAVESVYYSAVLFKVQEGGWVPLVIAATCLTVMYSWHYGTIKRYEFEMQNKVSVGWVVGLAQGLGLVRVPGIGLVYTDLAHGVPPILSHFVTNLPALHSIVVFVCIKYLPVNTVPQYERFHIKRIGPKSFSMFRCAARYGYMDVHKKDDDFEHDLIAKISQYITFEALEESMAGPGGWSSDSTSQNTPRPLDTQTLQGTFSEATNTDRPRPLNVLHTLQTPSSTDSSTMELKSVERIASPELQTLSRSMASSDSLFAATAAAPRLRGGRPRMTRLQGSNHSSNEEIAEETDSELVALQRNREIGVVYLLGNIMVKARSGSGMLNNITINFVYAFLRRTCRESRVIYSVPHESLLQVGMVYYV